jgi:uncharacterized protein (DUF1800 family)
MRLIFLILFLSLSLYSLSLEETKHLLNRTSFGYTQSQLEQFQKLSKKEAIELLLSQKKDEEVLAFPKDIRKVSVVEKKKDISREDRKVIRKIRNKKMHELKVWWYKMILNERFSFRERMTLFWHNHFVSEYRDVKNPYMMVKQNMLFREHALGNFKILLNKSSQDLAMLIYLDSNSNKRNNPNENYARELLELFTLGEGHYSELDVKEAARAFTGYRVNKKQLEYKFIKKHHDYGKKTFLSKSGTFNGSDIINIILEQEQTSTFITEKLYKEFISQKLDTKEVMRLSKIFRQSNCDISVLMKNILLSEKFWDNKLLMIKSPVEQMVSLLKALDINLQEKDFKFIINYGKRLGQDLFNPPNVKGWIAGKAWIDSSSFILRKEYTIKLLRRALSKSHIKDFYFENFDEFQNYFFPKYVKSNTIFRNKKKDYISLLSQEIYFLK